MEIGEPLKRWEIIPLTEPVPGEEPEQPQPQPKREQEKEPA